MPEYHVGWPTTDEEKLDRVRRGLPVYCPRDPKVIEQASYIRFAEKRPPNSK
jgi:hypothetical protein